MTDVPREHYDHEGNAPKLPPRPPAPAAPPAPPREYYDHVGNSPGLPATPAPPPGSDEIVMPEETITGTPPEEFTGDSLVMPEETITGTPPSDSGEVIELPPQVITATPTAPDSLQHANLVLYEPVIQGTAVTIGPVLDEVLFAINPRELTIAASADWQSKPAKAPQPAEFTGRKPQTLQFEVLLDKAITGEVTPNIAVLLSLCRPIDSTEATNPRPPFVQLTWGILVTPAFITKSVNVKLTRFDPDGNPTRAIVSLSLEEAMVDIPRQNPTSGGPSGRRVHVAVAGDTLPSIATAEYGDPRQWRAVAAANRIDDPMRLLPGTRLLLPRHDDLPTSP